MDKSIIDKLIKEIKETNLNKSSHWEGYLPDDWNYLNHFENNGFGGFIKKSPLNYIHNLLTKIIFGDEVFKNKSYYAHKSIFDEIDRYINIDTIRHILTFEKIREHLNPKIICIIGDGKVNGVLSAHLTFPSAKIYSVNLSEVLINDYIILDRMNIDIKKSVALAEDINFFDNKKKLTLVPSSLKEVLLNKSIELFINIASFQEMTKIEINNYFEIIKNNKSKLYCCNREYKKLPNGEEIIFEKYPFAGSKRIFWENCPWHQKFYSLKPPFIRNYDGNHKHCLVDFS